MNAYLYKGQKIMKAIVSVLIILLALSGCQRSSKNPPDSEYAWIYSAEPGIDVKKAIEKGDLRFMGTYDYSLSVVGVKSECVESRDNINPIEGTSDVWGSYESAKFNTTARLYAEHYNIALLNHLDKYDDCVAR